MKFLLTSMDTQKLMLEEPILAILLIIALVAFVFVTKTNQIPDMNIEKNRYLRVDYSNRTVHYRRSRT